MKPVVIRPLAEADLQAARDWYESKLPGAQGHRHSCLCREGHDQH